MVWLAFDFGEKFIGIAVVELSLPAPRAMKTIRAKGGVPHWVDLDAVFADWRPEGAVVGLPLNMDDSESEMSRRARRFARRLSERYAVPIEFADERLTSFEADDRGGKRHDHALAAQVIAETWLSARSHAQRPNAAGDGPEAG